MFAGRGRPVYLLLADGAGRRAESGSLGGSVPTSWQFGNGPEPALLRTGFFLLCHAGFDSSGHVTHEMRRGRSEDAPAPGPLLITTATDGD